MNETMKTVMEVRKQWILDQATKEGRTKKWISNRVEKLEAEFKNIENANPVKSVEITIEWKKTRTWGNCPCVEVVVVGEHTRLSYTAYASGCGYDKESTAVAQALNQSPQLLKLLYEAVDTKGEKKPYGIHSYSSGVGFEGGVGMSCYRSISDFLGCSWTEKHGKTWDYYEMNF